MLSFKSTSVDTTRELGYKFAKNLKKGDILVLNGDLGSGKTIFVSGFLSLKFKINKIPIIAKTTCKIISNKLSETFNASRIT